MMKAGFCNAASKLIAVVISGAFKSDYQIEWAPGNLTFAGGDDVRMLFAFRDADRSLVRMSRKEPDDAAE